MTATEWLSNVLHRCCICKPDGRPFYRYRITKEEFDSLKEILCASTTNGLHHAIRTFNAFDMMFVMYGAEWWRREYNGQWGWECIFKSFNASASELTANQRNEFVETGLNRWGRQVRINNNRRIYLGSVAIEGGLPLTQMIEGRWQPILKQVTQRFSQLGENGYEPSYIVSQYSHYLPKFCRNPKIYEILGDMVATAVDLKREHNLISQDNPIVWLDNNVPRWREQFPLPVNDDVGITMLTDMVNVAVSARESETINIEGTRFLSGVSTNSPDLNFILETQTFYSLSSLMPNIEDGDIPHRLQVELFDSSGKTWPFAEAYQTQWKGKPALKFNNRRITLKNEDAIGAIRLRFKIVGKTIYEMDIESEALDTEIPWTFAEKGDDGWQLVGQASQKLKDAEAIIWAPNTLKVAYDDTSKPEYVADSLGGCYFKIKQPIELINSNNDRYVIETSQEEETLEEYFLKGKRLPYACSPVDTFIGKPKLRVKNRISGEETFIGTSHIRARPVSSNKPWQTLNEILPGVHEIQVVDNSIIKYRKRIAFLPETCQFSYSSGDTPQCGAISVKQVDGWQATCQVPGVYFQIEEDATELKMQFKTLDLPPASVNINFWTDESSHPLRITLPYPSEGAMLFNAEGQKESNTSLFLDGLHGYRIKFFVGANRPVKSEVFFRLEVEDYSLNDTSNLYIEIRQYLPEGVPINLPLVDFHPEMRELLSVSKNLDAYIRFIVLCDGCEQANLEIRRFQAAIEQNQGEVVIRDRAAQNAGIENAQSIRIGAMKPSQPEYHPVQLPAKHPQTANLGSWDLSPTHNSPGPWLIHSLKGSEILKPLKIESSQPATNAQSVRAAIRIKNPADRQKALNEQFSAMARDSEHGGWDYLRSLWDNYGHLPLATFDIWVAAATNSRLLAAIALHLEPAAIDRIQQEFPVVWELIPISVWEAVLNSYKDHLFDLIDDSAIEILRRRLNEIGGINDIMDMVTQVLRQRILDEAIDNPLPIAALAHVIKHHHQELLQRQSDAQWPPLLKDDIQGYWANLPSDLHALIPNEQYHRATIVYLPVVLAYHMFHSDIIDDSIRDDPIRIFKIKRLKQFDEHWYTTAFRCICGFLSQKNQE